MVGTIPRSLTRIHAALARTFDVYATVLRKTQASDNAGGFVDAWVEFASYPTTFSEYPVRTVERENTVRPQSMAYWQFIFAFDADVRVTDRIVVGTRTFEIGGGGVGSMGLSLRMLALELI